MLVVVIGINLLISLACLYVARQIWRYRLVIEAVERRILNLERQTYWVLSTAPQFVLNGQRGSNQLRQQYDGLQGQLRQLEQGVALVSLGLRLWKLPRRRRK